jgi:hypothetical protein
MKRRRKRRMKIKEGGRRELMREKEREKRNIRTPGDG